MPRADLGVCYIGEVLALLQDASNFCASFSFLRCRISLQPFVHRWGCCASRCLHPQIHSLILARVEPVGSLVWWPVVGGWRLRRSYSCVTSVAIRSVSRVRFAPSSVRAPTSFSLSIHQSTSHTALKTPVNAPQRNTRACDAFIAHPHP